MRTRETIESQELTVLAAYGAKSSQSRGRQFPELEHPLRTAFQRDRDRIIHSRAFRRLEYKTQVFVNHEGDHYRTRLTHSMEVAQIARIIARALGLNEDLAEAVSLVHDVGHPPFGHSGEKALSLMMADLGGFEHNQQSLRIVEKLEKRYPQFDGLNLTWEVRGGIQKHRQGWVANSTSLEAQVSDISDDIAYLCHDVDDGLASGLIHEGELDKVSLWRRSFEEVKTHFPDAALEVRCFYTVRNMINTLVTDLLSESEKKIIRYQINQMSQIQNHNIRFIDLSENLKKEMGALREFLFKNLYTHPQIEKMNNKAQEVVCDLFKLYMDRPELLKETTQAKLKDTHPKQVLCDYIAGMTDRFALQEHRKYFDLEDHI